MHCCAEVTKRYILKSLITTYTAALSFKRCLEQPFPNLGSQGPSVGLKTRKIIEVNLEETEQLYLQMFPSAFFNPLNLSGYYMCHLL
jgi:hypothetical protein